MAPPKKYPKSIRAKDAFRALSRAYASVNLKKSKEYYDDTLAIEFGSLDHYFVIKQVGRGKYGEVFEVRVRRGLARPSHACVHGLQGTDKRTNSSCVIKIMKPVKEHRLRREIKILRHLSGAPHIIRLIEVALAG